MMGRERLPLRTRRVCLPREGRMPTWGKDGLWFDKRDVVDSVW